MASTKAIRIGTYRSSSVRPPRDALGRVKEGMLPKMISRTSGKPMPQMGPTRSRRNSWNSVRVRRRSAAPWPAAREGAPVEGPAAGIVTDIVPAPDSVG